MAALPRNYLRNCKKPWCDWYLSLPYFKRGMTIRCPTHNSDGSEIDDDDCRGCGSDRLSWDGDVYDCRECGIFFASHAADPPHQREKHE